MKNIRTAILHFWIIIFTVLFIASCAPTQRPSQRDLLTEGWMQRMPNNPNLWTKNADPWFFTGEPQQLTLYARHAPLDAAISNTMVRVANFTNIVIYGNYRVQIVGSQDHNSVTLLGPNEAVREAAVSVNRDTLFIHQVPKAKHPCEMVIIRIGVNNLRKLIVNGNGSVVGQNVYSDNLTVITRGGTRMILRGPMNVTRIKACHHSSITLLGVIAPCLSLRATENASVNVLGRVGIQQLANLGNGTVTILGADSNRLMIRTLGNGTTNIVGIVNLRKIIAGNTSHVYVYCVKSPAVQVKMYDAAEVGLAGIARSLYVDASGNSRFKGSDLIAMNAYVKTYNTAHANISARNQFFGYAHDYSSIYFMGSPSLASRYTDGKAVILPMWTNSFASPPVHYPTPTPWNFKGSHAYTTPYNS